MDRLTKEQRTKNMKAVKSSGSKIEIAVGKALWSKGYRYRKNDKAVFGKPDLTFKKLKIAVFIDGDFWHGRNWEIKKNDHKSNQEFWLKKIANNIARDVLVNEKLTGEGWIVLRFWGTDVKKDLLNCVDKVEETINAARRKNIP